MHRIKRGGTASGQIPREIYGPGAEELPVQDAEKEKHHIERKKSFGK